MVFLCSLDAEVAVVLSAMVNFLISSQFLTDVDDGLVFFGNFWVGLRIPGFDFVV